MLFIVFGFQTHGFVNWFLKGYQFPKIKFKPGGLDSRDQSRSRSRTSLASRPVFKTCRDFLDGRDQLLFYLGQDFLNRDFLIETWLCRDFIEIVETNRDIPVKSRFFEIFVSNQDFFEINRDFVEINQDFFSLD